MKLTQEQLAKVAHLARIEWNENRAAAMGASLNQILAYMDELNEVDTDNVRPTIHAVELENAWREDTVEPSLSQEEALRNAPERNEIFFKVPKLV